MAMGERDIHIFLGGDDGGGDSLNIGRDAYHWTLNWNCLPLGAAVPSIAPVFVAANLFGPIGFVLEMLDDNDRPMLLGGMGIGSDAGGISFLIQFQDGTVTVENQTSSEAPWTGGVLYRYDDAGTADNAAAWFGNGVSGGAGHVTLHSRDPDGTIGTSSHTQYADSLWVIGSDLWISQGYKVLKLTTDSDPGVTGSYGSAIPVGKPTYPVNAIVDLGGSPVVAKGDGLFIYNPAPSTAEYQSIVPMTGAEDPENGKATFTDGRGRVYYDTAGGDIIVVTPGFLSHQEPGRTVINRDTPFGHITWMTADIDHVYAAVEPGPVRTQQLGIHLQTFDASGASYTNITTVTTDQKDTTSADLSGLDGGSGPDFLYIGADEPFWGVFLEFDAFRDNAKASTHTIEYSKSSGFQTATAGHDGTQHFTRNGCIVVAVTGGTDIVAASSNKWEKQTVNSVEKYWIRLGFTIATNEPGNTKIREAYVCPYRSPLAADAASATHPLSGYALAHVLPKILVGTWKGETIQWDDVWTLDGPAVTKLVIGHTEVPGVVSRRKLYAFSKAGVHTMPVGDEGDGSPMRAFWPKLADYGESTVAMDEHVIAFSGNDFGLPQNVKRISGKLSVDFPWRQSDDETYLVYWWDDDTDRYYQKELQPDESFVEKLEGEGRVLYTALIWKDGSRDAVAPYLRYVGVPAGQWEDLGPMHKYKADIASPMNR